MCVYPRRLDAQSSPKKEWSGRWRAVTPCRLHKDTDVEQLASPIFFDVTFARISLIRCRRRPNLKWRAELFDDGWLVDSILLEIWWKYYTPSVGIGCPIYRLSIAGGGRNVPTTCCFVISTHRQLRREEDERLNFFLDRRAGAPSNLCL